MDTAPTASSHHLTLDELRAALPHLRSAPADAGTLRLIVRRPAVETRETLEVGSLDEAEGLVGDNWRARASSRTPDGRPHPGTQITLMSVRAIGAICPDEARWPLAGDQLFVDLDLTYRNLPPGTRLQVGDAVLEVTGQPHTGCAKFIERFGLDAMTWVNSPEGRDLNLRGIYAKVVTNGSIRRGDTISKRGAALRVLRLSGGLCVALAVAGLAMRVDPGATQSTGTRVRVSFPAALEAQRLDGRLLVMLSTDPKAEPRFQIVDGPETQLVFGIDVDGLAPGAPAVIDAAAAGYPLRSLRDVPAGTYTAQALLHRYETFRRADGHVVKLPMDRGEGQQWNLAPGNLYSTPAQVTIGRDAAIDLTLDKVIPPIAAPPTTKYIRHERIRSEKLSRFWGRDMYLGAHVLVPEGFDTHHEARYPLMIDHGHFPYTFGGFREEPPDPNLKPDFSARFNMSGYNRYQQQAAYDFYKEWTGPGFPRVLVIQIQHPTPFYDDSYAVNSANAGPWGDAIVEELIPFIEKKYRGIGQGWTRFMYGGSTGGWEALAAQVFYPDAFNGAYAACPDPIDFRAYTVVNLYEDRNAYFLDSAWKRTPRPGMRNWLGQVSTTIEEINLRELALGSKTRSGQQWDVWEATYSPVGPDGYPKPIWDKVTGAIDKDVAAYWRDNYDLMHIMKRDWEKGLGAKLAGKVNLYVGDMDNYYLNNAVYLAEDFLRATTNPRFTGEIMYGDRAEHCWNGDPTRPNYASRLRYHQMYIPKAVARMEKTAPQGADVKSWRY